LVAAPHDTTAYRTSQERFVLALTLLLSFLIILLTAAATFCLSGAFVIAMVALSYLLTRSRHRQLLQRAIYVTPQSAARLSVLVEESIARLRPDPVQVFVAPSRLLNAYTFGLSSPKVLVLESPLLEVMDEDELRFIIGHELGHVRLGHTWLNSLVGGMAGVPSPFFASAVLALVFLWWNRSCEISADRAGLLACGRPDKAFSALLKLAAGGELQSEAEVKRVWELVEKQDDDVLGLLAGALGTHPMMARRIKALQRYAGSPAYRRLQALLDQNVAASSSPHSQEV